MNNHLIINKILLGHLKEVKEKPADADVNFTDGSLKSFTLNDKDGSVSFPQIEETVNKLNHAVQAYDHKLLFKLHYSHNSSPLIQVVDVYNGRIIKTIPPQNLLKVAENIESLLSNFIMHFRCN